MQIKTKHKTNDSAYNSWREENIVKYAYLVKHIASRIAMRLPSCILFDELVSAGSLGLIDAVDKFDPERHVSLQTYSKYRIKGAILDELRSLDSYSRSLRKKVRDIAKAVKAVEGKNNCPATDEEICEELGIELDEYYDMLTNIHGASVLNLDDFIKNRDNDTYSKVRFQLAIKDETTPADSFDKKELKKVMAQAIKSLTKKEQMVVSLYYYDELTLKEIGEVLSLTESRICQIHTLVLVKLKSRLQNYFN